MELENHSIIGDFCLFELGGVDVILGVAWLETLGEVRINWRTLSMKFSHQGQQVQINGDSRLSKTMISAKTLEKLAEIESASMILIFAAVEPMTHEISQDGHKDLPVIQSSQLEELLTRFAQVFVVPEGPPPSREVDQ